MSRSVAVVFGGASVEAEVSRVSAGAVAAALESRGYRVTRLRITPSLTAELSGCGAEVVFPTAHGPLGEDGCLQGLLEIAGIPYVGSGVMASALGANKRAAKVQFEAAGLPVARGRVVTADALDAALPGELRRDLGAALVTKPMSGGSGIGVTRISNTDPDSKLEQALVDAFEVDARVLVEAFKLGDEVTCGVLEDDQGVAKALPPTRVIARAADWYDFTSRYGTGGSEHECPARYFAKLNQRIQDLALRAHIALEARDLSRVDFVVSPETGEVTVLELNTLPGMTATSLFPEAAGAAGVGFEDLCVNLVERAAKRPLRSAPEARPMPA
jgi:D-alanine-D-alanine ligase